MTSSWTKTSDVRRFGVVAFVFFLSLFSLGIWTQKTIPTFLFAFLSICGFALMLFPSHLRPVYVVWLRLARFLGKVVTIIILSMAYFIVITPLGFIKRLVSGTPIVIKPDKDSSSYWMVRTEPIQPKERYTKRY
jgi:hypothetical protein